MLNNTVLLQKDFGSPAEVLFLSESLLSELEDNNVRVQMRVANINPSDMLSIRGVGQYRRHHKPPRIPGFEGVGIVYESKCSSISVGQKVVVAHVGTWQQYIDVNACDVFSVPNDMSDGFAAQLYINTLTSWVILKYAVKINNNSVVMINAGCSAIGRIFAQLSQSMGFTLIAVTSHPDECCFGAEYVIDSDSDIQQELQRCGAPTPNVFLDAIGGQGALQQLSVCCDNTQVVTYGTLSMQEYPKDFYQLIRDKSVSFEYFFLRYWEEKVGIELRNQEFKRMLNHFQAHNVHLNFETIVPVENFHIAFNLLSANVLRKGKILLSF